ncbi:unnamed protein product [Alternaria alternata]
MVEKSASLVAVMALVGACLSAEDRDHASAQLWFDLVEDLVYSDVAFDDQDISNTWKESTDTDQKCFIELKAWRERMGIDATNMNVLSAVIALCDNVIMTTPAMRRTFANLSVLNMFTIVHALYLQVYSLENSAMTAPDTTRKTSVENALRNWQQLWPSHTRDMELVDLLGKESDLSTMWQRIGFMRYAPEYWLIAYSTVKKMYKQNDEICRVSETAITVGNHDMIEARRLITELRSGAIVLIVDS